MCAFDTLPCPKCETFNTLPKYLFPEDEQGGDWDWSCLNVCFHLFKVEDVKQHFDCRSDIIDKQH